LSHLRTVKLCFVTDSALRVPVVRPNLPTSTRRVGCLPPPPPKKKHMNAISLDNIVRRTASCGSALKPALSVRHAPNRPQIGRRNGEDNGRFVIVTVQKTRLCVKSRRIQNLKRVTSYCSCIFETNPYSAKIDGKKCINCLSRSYRSQNTALLDSSLICSLYAEAKSNTKVVTNINI
jgi:hypothetical protein